MSAEPKLTHLAAIMARYGSLTFGGGGPTAVALERVMVHESGWLSRPPFRLSFALSRLTPGTNMFAFCTALGWQVRGVTGALIALGAASLPCSALTLAITVVLDQLQDNATAAFLIQVAAAISIGLVAASCWPLVRPHFHRRAWLRAVVLLAGSAALQLAGAPPIRVLLAAAIVGSLWREADA